jgi:hypothetical protein
MQYFKINFTSIFDTKEEVLECPMANLYPNGQEYFERIGYGEIIEDASVFDYFHLRNFAKVNENHQQNTFKTFYSY